MKQKLGSRFTFLLLFLGFSMAAHAQTTYSVGSTPVTTVVESGITEKVGDIVFTPAPGSGATVQGTVTIHYGLPVTYPGWVMSVSMDGLSVPSVGPLLVQNDTLSFTIVPFATNPSMNYYIRVGGARVNAAQNPSAFPLIAQITAVGNKIMPGQNYLVVIMAASAGIQSFGGGPAVRIGSVTGAIHGANQVTLNAVEGFPNAFGMRYISESYQASAQRIKVLLDQRLPLGVSVSFPSTDSSGKWSIVGNQLLDYSSGDSPAVYYQVIADTDALAVESFALSNISVEAVSAEDRGGSYPNIVVNATVSLAPIDTESPTSQPRYRFAPVGAAPIIAFFRSFGDMDADDKSDITVWRPSSGMWYTLPSKSPGNFSSMQWGVPSDRVVPGDYDGDGRMDIAVWRPYSGTWFIKPSSSPGSFTATQWGLPSDIPYPADYGGDGKTDIAVWRPANGMWYILPSEDSASFTSRQWGLLTDVPVPADYDGDRKADLAFWRPSNGTWYILPSNSSPGAYTATQWGLSTDVPVPCDYDGDGKTDLAIWRPSEGMWYILSSNSGGVFWTTQWGVSTDIPSPIDFNGDGVIDLAVWRPAKGTWYVLPSNLPGGNVAVPWGTATDIPVSLVTRMLLSWP